MPTTRKSISIAVDDFGVGVSGYKMLYQTTPDIIKIDRFFLGEISKDLKKKILVRSIVQLATQLGITVIAEGVETEIEMLVCKELGCHLMQGYFVQHPTCDTDAIVPQYHHVRSVSKRDRRSPTNKQQIKAHVKQIEPIMTDDSMDTVLKRFRENHQTALPVVGKDRVPLGILDEEQVRELISSPYGRAILLKASPKEAKIKKYVLKCAMADIHTGMDQLVECFANYKEARGVIITQNMEYYGFLDASDIIEIINARNLASARDQNPLTKMPGNQQIDRYINDRLSRKDNTLFCYFDLNHFKAYNDTYGFRNGDRVIQLFADLLNKELPRECFKGHIGGDDFFAGVKLNEREFEAAIAHVKELLDKFSEAVRNFYDTPDRERGYIVAKDREGRERTFELLSASAVAIKVHRQSRCRTADTVHRHFAMQKKTAKEAIGNICACSLL